MFDNHELWVESVKHWSPAIGSSNRINIAFSVWTACCMTSLVWFIKSSLSYADSIIIWTHAYVKFCVVTSLPRRQVVDGIVSSVHVGRRRLRVRYIGITDVTSLMKSVMEQKMLNEIFKKQKLRTRGIFPCTDDYHHNYLTSTEALYLVVRPAESFRIFTYLISGAFSYNLIVLNTVFERKRLISIVALF